MRRAVAIEPEHVRTLLDAILDLVGHPLSGYGAMRRLNDLRPVVGALVDLASERDLSDQDLAWAATEIRQRAETHQGGDL
jgi:hypothetical protein